MPVQDKHKHTYPGQDKIVDALAMYIRIHGGPNCELSCNTIYNHLADYFGLTEVDRRLSRADYYTYCKYNASISAWNTVIQWARQKLKTDGYLAKSRPSVWKLSTAGIQFADGKIAFQASDASRLANLTPI